MIRQLVSISSCFLINIISGSNAFNTIVNDSLTSVCKIPDLKSWIYFQYDKCIHLIVNDTDYSSICIKDLIDSISGDGIVIYQNSPADMKNRTIFIRRKTNCESYLFVMENPEQWFGVTDKTLKIFYPFSRLYFLSLYANEVGPFQNHLYFHRNALFGYKFNFDSMGSVTSIRDLVGNVTIMTRPNFMDLSHPLVDRNDRNHQFTVSTFYCPPHMIYLNENGTR